MTILFIATYLWPAFTFLFFVGPTHRATEDSWWKVLAMALLWPVAVPILWVFTVMELANQEWGNPRSTSKRKGVKKP